MAERPAKKRPTEATGQTRSGRVAILGRPNVGKSTLLNAALDQPLSIVSPTPQTTRDAILGIVRHGSTEIALIDTPGLHKAGSALGRAMNRSARDAAKDADVVVFVAEVPPAKVLSRGGAGIHPGDASLLADIPAETPVILVLNKVDLAKNKEALLPLLQALSAARDFAAVVPVSALRTGKGGVARVLDEVAKLCPQGPHQHAEDEITDRPVRFFAAEYVREQILRATKEEVPHAVAVEVTEFREPGPGRKPRPGTPAGEQKEPVVRIEATIHVERPGQKKILVGTKAEMLKRIGTAARKRIEELLGRRVHLQLFVRVTADWRDSPQQLEELGYQTPRGAGAGSGPNGETQ